MFNILLRCYTINNKNSIPVVYKILRKYCTTNNNIRKSYIIDQCKDRKIFALHTGEDRISKLKRLTWCQQTRFLDINTNVKNHVFLYKHENLEKSHRNILLVAVAQMLFWAGLTVVQYYVYTESISGDLPLFHFAKSYGLHTLMFLLTIIAGPLVLITACALIKRSVKYVILNKGGKEATIVTYHPFRKDRRITVPVEMVSTKNSRVDATNHVALKIQGYIFKFILEKKGVFVNPDLFDCTVGQIKR